MTFTRRLLVFGITLSVVPLLAVGFMSWRVGQQATAAAEAQDGTIQLARADLDHIVGVTYIAVDNLNQVMTSQGGRSGPDPVVIENLLNQLKDFKVGRTGYMYILQASGPKRGAYVLSLNRKRDGEILWEARDGDGALFIQSIINSALKLSPGELGEKRYPWKNANDPEPVMKLVRFKYFAAWDWVIAAGIPEPELFATAREVERLNQKATFMVGVVTLAALLLSSIAWMIFGRRLTRQLGPMVSVLSEGAHHIAAASEHVSSSSQALAHGASQQAASIQETSASMEELSSITQRNADSARSATDLMTDVGARVHQSTEALHGMVVSMGEIQESSQRVAKIIKTIDEIAFQTNILALNAAVEAARAGEAGMGFAVVAGEVRNLAQRSGAAAHDTAALIEESIARAQTGVKRVSEVETAISGIADSVSRVQSLVNEVSTTSRQQTDGLGLVKHAIGEISGVTQSTAATAEESAAASQELAAQAETAMQTADSLSRLIGGNAAATTDAPAAPRPPVRPAMAKAAMIAMMVGGLVSLASMAGAQTPLQFKTEDGATTLKVGTLVQGLIMRDTGGSTPINDVYFRRIRLVAGGQIQKRLKYFVDSDTPYLGRKNGTWQVPPTIVQDVFVTYEFTPTIMVDAGLMLVPNSYNSTQSAASLLPIAYGPYSFLSSAPTYSRVGRDQGVQARGYVGRGHFEYRLGVFRGLSRVDTKAGPRVAGRAVWYPFASQTGFFYAGTLQGKKRMVAIGASFDRENHYHSYGGDVFVEWPVARGVVTGQAGLLRFNGGRTFAQLPLQNTWLAEAGFSVPARRFGVFAQAARQDVRAMTAADATSFVGGVTYWLRPSVMNIKAGIGRTMKDGSASHTQVSMQLQLFIF